MTNGNFDTDGHREPDVSSEMFTLRRLRAGQRGRGRPAARDRPGHGSSTSAGSAPRRRSDDRSRRPLDIAAGERQPAVAGASRQASAFLLHVVVVVLMILWLLPTIGLLVNSFRPQRELSRIGLVDGVRAAVPLHARRTTPTSSDQSGIGEAFVNSLFITIPATIIPILVAAFAAYAFSWMNFPGRNILFVVGRRAAGRPAPDDAHPDPAAVRRLRASPASSWRSGSPTPATACRSRSTCCATSWARCRGRSSSRPTSTARAP